MMCWKELRDKALEDWHFKLFLLIAAYIPLNGVALVLMYHFLFDTQAPWAPLIFPEVVAVFILTGYGLTHGLGQTRFPRMAVTLLVAAWLLSGVGGALVTTDPGYAFRVFVLQYILPAAFAYCAWAELNKFHRLWWFAFVVVMSGLLVFAVAGARYFQVFGVPWPLQAVIRNRGNLPALKQYTDLSFWSVNVIGSVLAVLLCLALGVYGSTKVYLHRALAVVAICVFFANLVLVYSRGVFFSLLVGMAIFVGLELYRAGRRSLWGPGVIIMVLVGCVTFGLPELRSYALGQDKPTSARYLTVGETPAARSTPSVPKPSTGQSTSSAPGAPQPTVQSAPAQQAPQPWIVQIARRYTRDPSVSNRVVMWVDGIQQSMRQPLTGVGFGEYAARQGLRREANAHNLYVNRLLEGGLPGMLSFCGLILAAAWGYLRLAVQRRMPQDRAVFYHASAAGLVVVALIGASTGYELYWLGSTATTLLLVLLLVVPALGGESLAQEWSGSSA